MTVADEILDIINEEQGWTGGKHPRAPKGKKKKDKYKGGEFVPKDAGGVTAKAPPDALHPIYKLVQKIRKNAKPVYQHQVGDIITYKGQEHKVVDRDKKGDFVFLKQQIPRVRVGSVQDVHQTLTIKVPASDISTAVRAIPGQDTLGLKGTLGKPVQPDLPPEVAKNIIAPEPKNEPLETKLFVSGPITQKKEGVTPLGEEERGINAALKVTIEGDGNGIWKPLKSLYDKNGDFEHEERLSKCPMGHREIMVSQIADILGPEFSDLVPKCVEKVMPNTANVFAGVRGSCMKWIKNFESCSSLDIKKECVPCGGNGYFYTKLGKKIKKKCDVCGGTGYVANIELERKIKSLPKGDLAHAGGFDDLIAGNDRHVANWGFSGNKLCFIDNGLSLGIFRDIAFIKRSFLREAGRRLDNFINANEIRKTQAYNTAFIRAYQHRDEITKVFETWQLTKEEQDAFWARVASVNRNLKNVLDNPPEPKNADIVITPNNGKHHLSSLDKKFDFRKGHRLSIRKWVIG